jgi:regulator of sigma E protease
VSLAVLPRAGRELAVVAVRDGGRVDVRVTPNAVGRYEGGDLGIGPTLRPQILQVHPGTPAASAGLERLDVIVAVDGQRGLPQEQIIERIRASAERPFVLTIERGGAERDVSVTAEPSGGVLRIGASISPWEVRHVDPNALEAVRLSVVQNWNNTLLIGRTLRGLVTRDTPVRQLMGPIGIAELSGTSAAMGLGALLSMMAMLSLNLGLLNLLPIPVLDGGHIAILAVEGLARRNLSDRVKERVLLAGAAAIVLLMVTVIYNDIARLMR